MSLSLAFSHVSSLLTKQADKMEGEQEFGKVGAEQALGEYYIYVMLPLWHSQHGYYWKAVQVTYLHMPSYICLIYIIKACLSLLPAYV